MGRISLWRSNKGYDYKLMDGSAREVMDIGGTGILVHKYLGVGENEDVSEVQDVLFLENRDRNYDNDVIELKGFYRPVDTDYDLSQFGILLSSDIVRFDFHYNNMIDKIGRKLISGDVFEVPAERDINLDGVYVNSYYVIQDALYSSGGRGPTWNPHYWKVRAKKLDGSPEFSDIIDSASKQSTLGNEGNFTGIMQQGIADFLEEDTVNQEVKNAIDRYSTLLNISNELVKEAENNVFFDPKFFNGQHLYIVTDENGYPIPKWWASGDGVPPNGAPLRGMGNSFPEDMEDGDYYLRLDYSPDRLFQKQGDCYKRIEDDLRKSWTAYNRRLDTYIDNNNITTFENGEQVTEQTSLHTVADPRVDLNSGKKSDIKEDQEKEAFISKQIGNSGDQERKWKGTETSDCVDVNIENIYINLPDGYQEIPPGVPFDVTISSDTRFSSIKLSMNDSSTKNYDVIASKVDGLYESTISWVFDSSFNDKRENISAKASISYQGNSSQELSKTFNEFVNGFRVVIDNFNVIYPGSQLAIKDAEEATVTFSVGSSNQSLQLGTQPILEFNSDLSIDSYTYDNVNKEFSLIVSRGLELFNYNEDNISIEIYSVVNKYENMYQEEVSVAHSDPVIVNNDPVEITILSSEIIPTKFSYPVKVLSASVNTDRGDLDNNTLPQSYITSLNKEISTSSNDIVSTDIQEINYEVLTLSGKIINLYRNYEIKAMNSQIITFASPEDTKNLQYQIDPADITSVTAVINTSPELQLNMNYVSDVLEFDSAEDFTITNNGNTVVINEYLLQDFYYINGVTLTMEIIL